MTRGDFYSDQLFLKSAECEEGRGNEKVKEEQEV